MLKYKILIFAAVPAFVASMAISDVARAESTFDFLKRVENERMQSLKDAAIVTFGRVAAPINRFLLIRKGKKMCAVRFTNFREEDGGPPTTFSSGRLHRSAEYEWYFLNDESGDFLRQDVKRGHGRVARGPSFGIGRLAVATVDTKVHCGTFDLGWSYPDQVDIFLDSKAEDAGLNLAPTAWTDISNVRGNVPELRWFSYDEARSPMIIPFSELEKTP